MYIYIYTGTHILIYYITDVYMYICTHARGTRTAGAPPTDSDLNKRPGQSADRIGKTTAFPCLPRTPVLTPRRRRRSGRRSSRGLSAIRKIARAVRAATRYDIGTISVWNGRVLDSTLEFETRVNVFILYAPRTRHPAIQIIHTVESRQLEFQGR